MTQSLPSLLPQQIAPVDAAQAALTERCLGPVTGQLMPYFLAQRAEVDATLQPRFPLAAGKAYPYGRCEEITRELYQRLGPKIQRPQHAVEHALHAFIAQGGIVHSVWGVLRGQYFQNALQFGGLYVDVSNDTVVVTKPQIEILPVAASGLVPVKDLAHFRETAWRYWGAEIYANHAVPTLAPLLPMISASPGKLLPGLQSACDYMIELMRRDHFHQAEAWLRDGPAPPAGMALAGLPADLRPWTADGRQEAILACQRARAAGCQEDGQWRSARVMDYLRIGAGG